MAEVETDIWRLPNRDHELRAFALVDYILTVAASAGGYYWAASFGPLFTDFRGELPAITQALLTSAPFWGVAALPSLVIRLNSRRLAETPKRYRWTMTALVVNLLMLIALLPLLIYAGYAPILALE